MIHKPVFDILVAGEINPDLIMNGDVVPVFGQVEKLVDSATLTIGSSSAIFACGAARLGLKVAFIGVCGDDVFGRFMLNEIQTRDVDISNVIIVPEGRTGFSIILNQSGSQSSDQGGRAILTHSGLIAALTAEAVTDNLLCQSRHLHVASYFLQTALRPGLTNLFVRARSLGLTTSLDPNWDPSCEWRGLDELLRQVDVFFPNENEALALTGALSALSAVDMLSQKCGTAALKLGALGALAARGEETVCAPALPMQVVDTIGAGDTFDAGFIYGFLHGWSLERTLRLGTVCGSLSTRTAGGTSAQPTLDEVMKYVSPAK